MLLTSAQGTSSAIRSLTRTTHRKTHYSSRLARGTGATAFYPLLKV